MVLCSKNKGVDQLRDYFVADLHICFRIYAKRRFLMTWLICYHALLPGLLNFLCTPQPFYNTIVEVQAVLAVQYML